MNGSAVDVRDVEPGIVQVTMQDRVNKNMFSIEIIKGMVDAFEKITSNTNLKVVVLTGYDHYFSCGATREVLLNMQSQKLRFYEEKKENVMPYSWGLDCRLPVIAAMQGHGIGGGLIFGLYCDIVVFSRESIYTASFMKYGFTPGMGATYILPLKLGLTLAEEIFLTARTYRGSDLDKRNIPFRVLPQREVLDQALKLARRIAEAPRLSLITLKDHLVGHIREKMFRVIAKEMEMHEKTFHQPEIKERILKMFTLQGE